MLMMTSNSIADKPDEGDGAGTNTNPNGGSDAE